MLEDLSNNCPPNPSIVNAIWLPKGGTLSGGRCKTETNVSTYRKNGEWWAMLTSWPSGQQAVTDLQDWPFWPCLVKPVGEILLVLNLFDKQTCQLTKEVEVLNELPLGAGLVRGTEDIGEQTTGEDTAQDTVSLDVRLVETAGSLATVTLVLVLVDGGGRAVGSNAEGEGEGSDNGGEVHCDGFWFSENERKCSSKGALEKSEDALRNWKIELL